MIKIILVLLAIGAVLAIVGGIFFGILKVFDGVFSGTKGFTAYVLGRKGAGEKPFIPAELDLRGNPLPKVDSERVALSSYKPTVWVTPLPVKLEFIDSGQEIFHTVAPTDKHVDIENLGELLKLAPAPTYERAFSILNENPQYPIELPTRPNPVPPPPPTGEPWRLDIAEPYFKPPLWDGPFAYFNKYVLAAYAEDISKVAAAKERLSELVQKVAERNEAVAALRSKAEENYQAAVAKQEGAYDTAQLEYVKCVSDYEAQVTKAKNLALALKTASEAEGAEGLLKRIMLTLCSISLPSFVSREYEAKFDEETGILIHEHRFPDLNSLQWFKQVNLKSGPTKKPVNQKEAKFAIGYLYPALSLRLASELIRTDTDGLVKGIAVNGWCQYTEKSTGHTKRAYCSSMFATRDQISNLNLSALDPIEAFKALKGLASRTIELAPIAPIIRLDTNDKRFVDAKEVLAKMNEGQNLASMDWEDFEHLCRELFERVFAGAGAEVKVTQASRDQGVDAVIFDPDPIRGGKIVIQAKRYTNTVDVSAVRDLYGAVMNEGAMKGILVTTSQYGPESYSFAKDKPLTLINGQELLGLLEEHGYKFRINLAEAKGML